MRSGGMEDVQKGRVLQMAIQCMKESSSECQLTLHIQSEVGCSPPWLIVAHRLVHSTVTPGGAGDGDGADTGGYPTTTGDDQRMALSLCILDSTSV